MKLTEKKSLSYVFMHDNSPDNWHDNMTWH